MGLRYGRRSASTSSSQPRRHSCCQERRAGERNQEVGEAGRARNAARPDLLDAIGQMVGDGVGATPRKGDVCCLLCLVELAGEEECEREVGVQSDVIRKSSAEAETLSPSLAQAKSKALPGVLVAHVPLGRIERVGALGRAKSGLLFAEPSESHLEGPEDVPCRCLRSDLLEQGDPSSYPAALEKPEWPLVGQERREQGARFLGLRLGVSPPPRGRVEGQSIIAETTTTATAR